MNTAIVWFRRDFRITDNIALAAAADQAAAVIPAYRSGAPGHAPMQLRIFGF